MTTLSKHSDAGVSDDRPRWMKALMTGALTVILPLCADSVSAQEASTTLTPAALAEIARAEAEIDRIEAQTLTRLAAPPDNQIQQSAN